jgi:hypothetical protein
MKKLLSIIDRWAAKSIKLIRPAKHDSPNVLTDDVHVKEKNSLENKNKSGLKMVIMPVQYYVTRTGQLIRKPSPKKKFIHRRENQRINRNSNLL